MASDSATPFAGRSLHFVGIGGAGMSGLALVAQKLGARVTGSDRADSPYCERLRAAGIEPAIGHDAANSPPGAELVVSTAIPEDNPEVVVGRGAGATMLHRGDLLGEVSHLKRTIAVGGTHGKTTTASMAAHVLRETGRDPGLLIGGELLSAGTNAAWGPGAWAVIEADESDRSFLRLDRPVAVITNIELDHHATYANLRELEAAFAEFAEPAELRILGPGVELSGAARERVSGAAPGRGLSARFGAEARASGAVPAPAACRAAGVEPAEAAPALATFTGAARRFEAHGRTASGARVFDDYAHHPTEVRATLEAARTLAAGGTGRLVACFQPHLYSRTRLLARDFGRALALADLVVVLDVYPARERAEDFPGVSGLLIAEAAADAAGGRPVWWLPELASAERMLAGELGERDLLVTLGAGDVDRVARGLRA